MFSSQNQLQHEKRAALAARAELEASTARHEQILQTAATNEEVRQEAEAVHQGELQKLQQRLDRVRQHAESIAFFGGGEEEARKTAQKKQKETKEKKQDKRRAAWRASGPAGCAPATTPAPRGPSPAR